MDPIRILHLGFGDSYYGTESVILNLYRHIDRSRYQFDFLVSHHFQDIAYEAEVEALGGHVYRQYYKFYEKDQPGYLSPVDFWKAHPEIQGGIHYNLNAFGIWHLQFLKAAKDLNYPIQLVHSHNALHGADSLAMARTQLQAAMLRAFAARNSNKRIACSQDAGRWGFGGSAFEVFPNTIEADRFAFDPETRARLRTQHDLQDKLVLGFVGRLTNQKYPEFLLEVLRALKGQQEDAVLVLLGEGELRGTMEELIQSYGLENRVFFMGWVDNPQEWMQAFDLLLLPSRHEGLGLVLVEAQASGLPCLASDQVPQEAKVTERLRYLSTQSPEPWVEAILTTDFSYDRRKGREAVTASGHDVKASARRLEAIYDELLRQHPLGATGGKAP